jgi:hypothetical protein
MILKRTQYAAAAGRHSVTIPTFDSAFDQFLYASIDETNDEMRVSVLSALARQNIDPWVLAAELTALPRQSAVASLAAIIASVTAGPAARENPDGNAARLVALLPRASSLLGIPLYPTSSNGMPGNFAPLVICLIAGGLILAFALLGH